MYLIQREIVYNVPLDTIWINKLVDALQLDNFVKIGLNVEFVLAVILEPI
jgi:hypothetical protein